MLEMDENGELHGSITTTFASGQAVSEADVPGVGNCGMGNYMRSLELRLALLRSRITESRAMVGKSEIALEKLKEARNALAHGDTEAVGQVEMWANLVEHEYQHYGEGARAGNLLNLDAIEELDAVKPAEKHEIAHMTSIRPWNLRARF